MLLDLSFITDLQYLNLRHFVHQPKLQQPQIPTVSNDICL